MFDEIRVLIKGAGDLATGVAVRLWRAGFRIAMTELPQPTAIRRTAAFAEAAYEGQIVVEGIEARRADSLTEIEAAWRNDAIPIIICPVPCRGSSSVPGSGDAGGEIIAALKPTVVVDAIMAKRNLGIRISDASLVIGLGPGFTAGQDVHAVVETNRGHYLGRVIWQGSAQPDTGVPGEIGGQARQRVIYAPAAGVFAHRQEIGAVVQEGKVVGLVDGTPVLAPISGVLRGLIHDGVRVLQGMKIGDVDPRGVVEHCFTVSDKALAIGGGVLEAILSYLTGHAKREEVTADNKE
jgi:xanthine dehydrogenase accessory factor